MKGNDYTKNPKKNEKDYSKVLLQIMKGNDHKKNIRKTHKKT